MRSGMHVACLPAKHETVRLYVDNMQEARTHDVVSQIPKLEFSVREEYSCCFFIHSVPFFGCILWLSLVGFLPFFTHCLTVCCFVILVGSISRGDPRRDHRARQSVII